MWDSVDRLYKALGIESTGHFVALVGLGCAIVFGVIGSGTAWVVARGYKNSPEYKAEHPDPKTEAVTPLAQTITAKQQIISTAPGTSNQPQVDSITPAHNRATMTKRDTENHGTPEQREIVMNIVHVYALEHCMTGDCKPPTVEFLNDELRKQNQPFRVKSLNLYTKPMSPGSIPPGIRNLTIDGNAAGRGCVPPKSDCTGADVSATIPLMLDHVELKNAPGAGLKTEKRGSDPCPTAESPVVQLNDVDVHHNQTGIKAEAPCLPVKMKGGQLRNNTAGVETSSPKQPQ